jgi:hypothetical protein
MTGVLEKAGFHVRLVDLGQGFDLVLQQIDDFNGCYGHTTQY